MKQRIKKTVFLLLRIVLIGAALWFIAWKVDWYDHATLIEGRKKLRVWEANPAERLVRADLNEDGEPDDEWKPEKLFERPKIKTETEEKAIGTALLADGTTGLIWNIDQDARTVLVDRNQNGKSDDEWTPESQFARLDVAPVVIQGLKNVISTIDWRYVIYAALIFSPNYVFLAWRLRLLLKTQDVNLRRRDAVKVSYASAFLNFAVPTGTTGGDIYKAWYVAAHATGRRTEAVTIVLLDRAVGLVNFIFMAAIVSLLSWQAGQVGALGGFVATMFAVTVVGACAYFSQRVRRLLRIDEWLPRIPKVGPHLVRIDAAAFNMRNHPRLLVDAFAWTIVVQTVVCVAVMLLARGVGMKCEPTYAHVLNYFLSIIVGLTVSALPGNPPQGFGVLEGIMAYILVPHFGTWSHIFAVCIGLRLLHLVWSFPGILVLLIEPRPKVGAPAGGHPPGDSGDDTAPPSKPPAPTELVGTQAR